MINSVSSEELKAMLKKDPGAAIVLDVRRRNDFQTDKPLIPWAQWKDPEHVENWGNDLPRDKAVVVYCVCGGSVSQSVAAKLAEDRVKVSYLEGGLAVWDQSAETPRS